MEGRFEWDFYKKVLIVLISSPTLYWKYVPPPPPQKKKKKKKRGGGKVPFNTVAPKYNCSLLLTHLFSSPHPSQGVVVLVANWQRGSCPVE